MLGLAWAVRGGSERVPSLHPVSRPGPGDVGWHLMSMGGADHKHPEFRESR